ncbi:MULTISPECIES: YkoP family protein [Bacillus]|uniref:YkoP family protein n=1 Tax=Bacillus TaxID=1386 RepID=UPI0002B6DB21|nr:MULTISPECIES: hypothetical protein [Bacillus]APH35293.1 hypothetical protein BHE96_06780 [Bacillus subtilis]MBA9147111.1 hypothetical protein [Bacillus sp. EKM213B]MBL3614002.1 hypothetical protein [Bacillus sp. RHFS18]MBR7814750.1 hypothetical protein [Bacillus sp. CCNWLCWHY013]AMQ73774.1 hypothetical protein BAMY6614_10695 [Bacillus amyloliquefaciens UMAF6614]
MRSCLLSIWYLLDPLYFFFTRLTLIDKRQSNVFRVRLTRYKGKDVILSDGTRIKKNDVLVKIHLHNVKLLKELQPIESAVRRGIMLYQKVYQSMPHLADYINQHKRKDEIKGVVGITMLHKGAARLGFDVIKPSSGCYRLFKKAAHIPILYFTAKQLTLKNIPYSCYLFISKEKLMCTYQTEKS